jgi:16S rRNA G527 N7-methylase RsmG
MSDSIEFRNLMASELGSELSSEQIERVVRFREEVLKENEIQNLTRLLSPKDFYEGHVLDAVHLKKSGLVSYPAMDLGAGMGVPGLLSALIYGENSGESWVSCDSETMKANFTARVSELFDLSQVSVTSERGETYLATHKVESIVARAVGPVSRIYAWLANCSTWNNLVLMKGPRWEEEWNEFSKTSQRNRLKVAGEYRYEVGTESKRRLIIRLNRN